MRHCLPRCKLLRSYSANLAHTSIDVTNYVGEKAPRFVVFKTDIYNIIWFSSIIEALNTVKMLMKRQNKTTGWIDDLLLGVNELTLETVSAGVAIDLAPFCG